MTPIYLEQEQVDHAIIKVLGIGGGGCNAIARMIEDAPELPGVDFIAVNTDAQVLNINPAPTKIQIGRETTKGLGAGANPEVGKIAAEESIEEIRNHLENTDLVFLTAGMGGGTGTGATPVIARVAKELNCLTVSIVTTPFTWEGPVRKRNALHGIEELKKYSDTIIVISNTKLLSIMPKKTTFKDAFKAADKVLKDATIGITSLIQTPGDISLDFADVSTIMKNAGKAHIGIGVGEGEDKAAQAVEQAIHSELLDEVSLKGAKGVIVNIIGGPDFTLDDVDLIMSRIYEETEAEKYDTNIIHGVTTREDMEGKIQVMVIATNIQDSSSELSHSEKKVYSSAPLDIQKNKADSLETKEKLSKDSIFTSTIKKDEKLTEQKEKEDDEDILSTTDIKDDFMDNEDIFNDDLDDEGVPPFLRKFKKNKGNGDLFKDYLD